MAGDLLLDTNVVVSMIKREAAAMRRIAAATEIFVSVVTIGELYFGALKSTQQQENIKRVEVFVNGIAVLPCDTATAHNYAGIKHQLYLKGKPIPENDVWLAAVAQQHNLTVLTRDQHFNHIDRLTIEFC